MVTIRTALLSLLMCLPALGCGGPHFGYGGESGPDRWGDLQPQWSTCKTGRSQSPIDITVQASGEAGAAVSMHYGTVPISLQFNGHTIQQTKPGKNHIVVDGKPYALAQFHFHSVSEHTFNKKHTAMEMHLVHKAADGAVAVVAVFIKPGAKNTSFAKLWGYLPTAEGDPVEPGKNINLGRMLPAARQVVRYMGSFTTPPCTEGVTWILLPYPVELSQAQIDAFRAIVKDNYRPTQALNGREVIGAR